MHHSFIILTAGKDLRRRLRDPLALGLWLGIPLAIGGMLFLAFGRGGTVTPRAVVLVADEDDSFLSHLLTGALTQAPENVPIAAERAEQAVARERIERGDGSALLIIPAGFGRAVLEEQPARLQLVTNPAQRILPGIVEQFLGVMVDGVFYAHRIFGGVIKQMTSPSPDGSGPPADAQVARIATQINQIIVSRSDLVFPPLIDVEIEQAATGEASRRGFAAMFFPSMLFMTLFFMASGMSEDVWTEKAQGTLRRSLMAPHRAGSVLAGKYLAAAVLIAMVSAIGLVAGKWGLKLELQNIALAVLWSACSGVLLIAMLFGLQLFASSQRGGSLLANLVTLPLLMLGGSLFPFELMPAWLAGIGRLTPNGWALDQLCAILEGQAEAWVLIVTLAGIGGVVAGLFWISVRRLAGAFVRN